MKLFKILPFILIFITLFVYTKDLKQVNPESLFLTTVGIVDYEKFKEKFPEVESIVVQRDIKKISKDEISKFRKIEKSILNKCEDRCEIVSFKGEAPLEGQAIGLIGEKHLGMIIFKREEGLRFSEIIEELSSEGFKISGHPYINYLLDKYSEVINEKLFPLMFAISFLALFALTLSFKDGLLLFFPSILSSVTALSIIKLFFGTMNMVTAIVPLVGFVITLSLSQHLYFSIKEVGDFEKALKMKMRPILLMLITTFVGFISLAASSIVVIRYFGILMSLTILLSSLVTIFWFKITWRWLELKNVNLNFFRVSYPEKSFSGKLVLGIIITSLFLGIYSFNLVPVVTDATEYFPKSSNFKKNIDEVSENVGGIPIMEIGFTLSRDVSYEDLLDFSVLESEIYKETTFKVISNNSMVTEANLAYSGNRELPKNYPAYLLLRSRLPEAIKELHPVGERTYRMTIMGKHVNVDQYELVLEKVQGIVSRHPHPAKIDGLYYNLMVSQKEMVSTLFKTFFISLLIISLIAFLAVRKLKVVLSFILVNLIPIGLSFTFIYLTGMSVNIATVMTYSIALGLVVDSSFHMIHALDHGGEFHSFVNSTAKPIITSSLILTLSFLLFLFYDFIPIREFGINLAFIIFIGMILDLFLLPRLYLGHEKVRDMFHP